MNKFSNMYSNLAQQANTFTHNVRNEVVSATLGTNEYTYSYDPIGNRTASTQNAEAKSYISNPLNQYIAIQQEEQTVAPIYDADGNMLSSPSGWSFTWNAENRLVSASRGGVVVSYTYDAFGRMISKQIIGAENKTITYTWDMFNIIKETENSNATYNIWGLDIDGTMKGAGGVGGLLAVAKSGSFYTPTYDANGNITEYVSDNGNIVAQYKYSAFGEIISQSGESFTHRFSTKPYCTTTGLVEYQFRKYDPILGRWLSRDPIEEDGGINLYAFCWNDGINKFDINGLYVEMEYDVENKTLLVKDVDTNETLTIVGTVFSGNGDSCCVKEDQWIEDHGPIPVGKYLVGRTYVPKKHTCDSGDYNWYRLYGQNGSGGYSYDKIPISSPYGKTVYRGKFNLHTGRASDGCVTVWSEIDSSEINYPQSSDYKKLRRILDKTKPLCYKKSLYSGWLIVK